MLFGIVFLVVDIFNSYINRHESITMWDKFKVRFLNSTLNYFSRFFFFFIHEYFLRLNIIKAMKHMPKRKFVERFLWRI